VFCVNGADPAFNPYGLPADYHDGSIWFHLADAKENFNECGDSGYCLTVAGDGSWKLWCVYNWYCDMPVGWVAPRNDGLRDLASGHGLKVDRVNGNKYRIDIRGRRIQIWVDGEQLLDVTDEKMDESLGGQRLDHGGVMFEWGWEAMGWIRNFSATGL
jgi:hypothetical protein